jgi:uncharacterized membrane protein
MVLCLWAASAHFGTGDAYLFPFAKYMIKSLILFALLFGLFLLFDAVWFRIAGDFLRNEVRSIITLTETGSWQVRLTPAFFAYFLMALGTTVFVLNETTSFSGAVVSGAIFGLVTFGIYDMTNLALLSLWTWRFAAIDMSWGIFANALVAGIGHWLKSALQHLF